MYLEALCTMDFAVSIAIFQYSLIQRLPWIIERTEMSTGLIVKCVCVFFFFSL